MIAQLLVEDIVNKEILKYSNKQIYPFLDKNQFSGEVAFINKYENEYQHLDWHSDILTYIGPHCVIASLSLGVKREFKFKKKCDEKNNLIYSIPLPHNTLCIMHAGCQEIFKHCITKSNLPINSHPISGKTRINITYRSYRKDFINNIPKCKCGIDMALKICYKNIKNRGRYFWSCEGTYQNNSCYDFYWADFNDKKLITKDYNKCSIWFENDNQKTINFN